MSEARPPHPVLATWNALRQSGAVRGALVTLVRADGGASRTLGTRLAVADDGRAFGSVTVGGCADGRALQAAKRVLETGHPERLTLPLSEADALALGLGCAGDVDVFVERVMPRSGDAAVRALEAAAETAAAGHRAVLVTPLDGTAGRLVVRADGSVTGGIAHAARDATGVALGREVVVDVAATAGVREVDGVSWFVEPIAPVLTLLVVGATEVAAALCRLAVPLGWRTVVIDPRDEVLEQPRFATAAERIPGLPAEIVAQRMGGQDVPAVVVVAHDYRVELPVLRAALAGGAPYVGMLGSRKRGETMRGMLRDDGVDAALVAQLRSPIGLPIGAEGPVEIAVSIVAELIATWRGAPQRG